MLGNGAALAPSAPTAWLSAANDAAIPELGYLTKWQLSPLRNDQPECTRSQASSPHLTIRAMWAFRPHEPVPLAVPVGPPPFSQNQPKTADATPKSHRPPAPTLPDFRSGYSVSCHHPIIVTAPQKAGTRINATAT